MRTLVIINWVIIGIYVLYGIVALVASNSSGMDAAGRGMAQGFLMIGAVFVVVLVIGNLINVRWVRIVTMVLGGLPVLYYLMQGIQASATRSAYVAAAEKALLYQDPHLNAIMDAIPYKDVAKIDSLLQENDSNINQIGATNRRTLLDISVQSSLAEKDPRSARIVTLLLKHGADPNIHHPDEMPTLLKYASSIPDSVFESLLKAGVDPNALDPQGYPGIIQARGAWG